MGERKVLIVDDDPAIRSLLKHILQKYYEVKEAESGKKALSALSNGYSDCDIVLMDQVMPEMDGMKSFEAIHELYPFLPVIMLTGYSSLHLGVEFMKNGGTDFVEKPVDKDMLLLKINRALEESESKKKARETEIENMSLEKANNAKNRFIAVMSHELRTPLNSVIGYSQMLKRIVTLKGDAQLYADYILKAGGHLTDLINDLLDISRIEAGAVSVHPASIEIDEIANQIREYLSGIDTHGLNVSVNTQPVSVHTDKKRLLQVIINLVSNAIKYTDEGNVSLNFELEEKDIRISVSDTGRGINSDRIPTLFKPDQQLLDGDRYDGLGVGLAISYELTRLMGSELTVKSVENEGSVFSFSLPVEVQN